MATGDFHLHSTASDGVHSPTWVVNRALDRGVQAISLSDHDSTEGLAEAQTAAQAARIRLIPGIELSTDLGTSDVHLLAYGYDPSLTRLQEFLTWQREVRVGRVEKIVRILEGLEKPIEVDRVFAIAGEASVGRPHVARALVEAGHAASVQEAFDSWLGNGMEADVPREKLEPKDAIALVHEVGGVVFAAHPYLIGEGYAEALEQLVAWGLDGIECYYKNYDPDHVAQLVSLAGKLGVQRSGGSDYHGLGNPDDREIGDIPFPDYAVEAFLRFIDDRCAVPAME
ncbi:MAG: PHP domain-containing protein [Dehalococcoidia bacterium]|nr:PHP domain-containing protein [Dehalococcoidia bacterium]